MTESFWSTSAVTYAILSLGLSGWAQTAFGVLAVGQLFMLWFHLRSTRP